MCQKASIDSTFCVCYHDGGPGNHRARIQRPSQCVAHCGGICLPGGWGSAPDWRARDAATRHLMADPAQRWGSSNARPSSPYSAPPACQPLRQVCGMCVHLPQLTPLHPAAKHWPQILTQSSGKSDRQGIINQRHSGYHIGLYLSANRRPITPPAQRVNLDSASDRIITPHWIITPTEEVRPKRCPIISRPITPPIVSFMHDITPFCTIIRHKRCHLSDSLRPPPGSRSAPAPLPRGAVPAPSRRARPPGPPARPPARPGGPPWVGPCGPIGSPAHHAGRCGPCSGGRGRLRSRPPFGRRFGPQAARGRA